MAKLKSDIKSLINRGFIDDKTLFLCEKLEENELFLMLDSEKSFERSIAIRLLTKRWFINEKKFFIKLLNILEKEKNLYTKLEITNSLEKWDFLVAFEMSKYLWKIWNNQYINLPERWSSKKSYPIPRDIIARTYWKMSSEFLPFFLELLNSWDLDKELEIIDAIWYILYYNRYLSNEEIFHILKTKFENSSNKILKWKIITALFAFDIKDSEDFLNSIIECETEQLFVLEAKRSLLLWKNKNSHL